MGYKFPNKFIHLLSMSCFLASELLADVDISEGATKKKQTRGNKKMNPVMINISLFLIAISLADVSLVHVHVHLLTVILWYFTVTQLYLLWQKCTYLVIISNALLGEMSHLLF